MAVTLACEAQNRTVYPLARRLSPLPNHPVRDWLLTEASPHDDANPQSTVWLAAQTDDHLPDWLARGGAAIVSRQDGPYTRMTCHYQGQQSRLSSVQGAVLPETLAAFLCHDYDLHDALVLACAWRGEDWPDTLADFPQRDDYPVAAEAFPPCPAALGVYPVVPTADWIGKLLALGIRTVQLRCKSEDPQTVDEEILQAVAFAKQYDRPDDPVRLFINDHWEMAIAHGAYGVHLGQEDLQTASLDHIRRAGLHLGVSTHGYFEMLRAHAIRPSYIAMGAVFATPTKQMPTQPQGVTKLQHYVNLMHSHYPLVAIGGISLAEMPMVQQTGVGSIAVVRAVTEAADLPAAVAALQAAMQG